VEVEVVAWLKGMKGMADKG